LIDKYSNHTALFNTFWWKHMPPPQSFSSAVVLKKLPIIITFRDPFDWSVSVFNFFKKEYGKEYQDIKYEDFIFERALIYDGRKYISKNLPRNYFGNIMDYYNYYYLTWLDKFDSDNIRFLNIDHLKNDLKGILARALPDNVVIDKDIRMPSNSVLPSIDGKKSELLGSEVPAKGRVYEHLRSKIYEMVDHKIADKLEVFDQ
jgi:hypothetical protein